MNVMGIPFTGENVVLMQRNKKHQTRRLLKPQPTVDEAGWIHWKGGSGALDCFADSIHDDCYYGIEGDVLYVREACRGHEITAKDSAELGWPEMQDGILYEADRKFLPIENTRAAADKWSDVYHYGQKRGHNNRRGRLVPPIHAPRWTSRLTLHLTHVRAEKLLAITDADARAEGMANAHAYLQLWDRLHGRDSHQKNPWVWVLEYVVNQVNVDTWLAQRKAA